jgi:hypothetical protein
MPDGGPVPVGQVDVAEGKGSWNERGVVGIELPLDPIGPYPVEVVLNGLGVDETTGMKNDPRTQELYRLLNLRGLGETSESCQQGEGVNNPMGPCRPFDEKSPWQPASEHVKKDTSSTGKNKHSPGYRHRQELTNQAQPY